MARSGVEQVYFEGGLLGLESANLQIARVFGTGQSIVALPFVLAHNLTNLEREPSWSVGSRVEAQGRKSVHQGWHTELGQCYREAVRDTFC